MGIDIVHVRGLSACVGQRQTHRTLRTLAFWGRRRYVMRVRSLAVAHNLGDDASAARLGELELLQHHHTAPLTEHEPVTSRVEWPARGLWRVVSGRYCLHRCKPGHGQRRNGGLGATRNHHVGHPIADEIKRVAHRMCTGGAGRDCSVVGPLGPILHRDEAWCYVRDEHRDEEWGDSFSTPIEVHLMLLFQGRDAADPAPGDHAEAVRRDIGRYPQSRTLHGLGRGGEREVREAIGPLHFLPVQVVRGVEVLDLGRETHRQVGRVEGRDGGTAADAR